MWIVPRSRRASWSSCSALMQRCARQPGGQLRLERSLLSTTCAAGYDLVISGSITWVDDIGVIGFAASRQHAAHQRDCGPSKACAH